MPRLSEAMKDVISCEKLRVGAHNFWSVDIPMGQPGMLKTCHHVYVEQTRRTETSKYPEEEKTIVIPLVAASERGLAQTIVVTAIMGL